MRMSQHPKGPELAMNQIYFCFFSEKQNQAGRTRTEDPGELQRLRPESAGSQHPRQGALRSPLCSSQGVAPQAAVLVIRYVGGVYVPRLRVCGRYQAPAAAGFQGKVVIPVQFACAILRLQPETAWAPDHAEKSKLLVGLFLLRFLARMLRCSSHCNTLFLPRSLHL